MPNTPVDTVAELIAHLSDCVARGIVHPEAPVRTAEWTPVYIECTSTGVIITDEP